MISTRQCCYERVHTFSVASTFIDGRICLGKERVKRHNWESINVSYTRRFTIDLSHRLVYQTKLRASCLSHLSLSNLVCGLSEFSVPVQSAWRPIHTGDEFLFVSGVDGPFRVTLRVSFRFAFCTRKTRIGFQKLGFMWLGRFACCADLTSLGSKRPLELFLSAGHITAARHAATAISLSWLEKFQNFLSDPLMLVRSCNFRVFCFTKNKLVFCTPSRQTEKWEERERGFKITLRREMTFF